MNVSTKRKDNKTVMRHKKHNNQKWNITRSPEFGSEISLRMENMLHSVQHWNSNPRILTTQAPSKDFH